MTRYGIYGIDVGTTKVVAISGSVTEAGGQPEIISVGEAPSHGLRRGLVVDADAARKSVSEAIAACGAPSDPVVVGIAGGHITSFNAAATLKTRSPKSGIKPDFVQRLKNEAGNLDPGPNNRIIHVVPRGFTLDGEEGIQDPIGMHARRVTMRAHVVAGAVSDIQSLIGVVEDCGVQVSQVVLEPLASSAAVFKDGDLESGVALVDIGGGTTDIASFSAGGALTHSAVVALGGQSLSSDLAYGLKLPYDDAERLKVRHGSVLPALVDEVATAELDGKNYSAHFMSQVLEYRAREILEFARDSLDEAGVGDHLSELVLTGGGSLLAGMPELAEDITGLDARLASPNPLPGEFKLVRHPQYSTAVGLLRYASKNPNAKVNGEGARKGSFGSIVSTIKGWLRGE
ncbi:cell division protein FtsA [soil metagenome]